MKIHALLLSVSVLTLGWGGAAGAATADATANDSSNASVGEVIVTAERRNENLQKTAIAATVMTGVQLQKAGVITVDQLQFISPSLTVNNFGQGDDFDIRGIGKGEHNTQTGTGVVTYRDGVATFPGYFAEEPYFDVAGLEILRGPQGTFSGQNATGGAVIVNTQNPVIDGGYHGYLLGHYGNYNDTGLQGAINLPISDTLAARVAFNTEYRDSFYHITGPWTGNPAVYWGSARFSLLWTPTPELKVLFKTDYDYLDNGGYFGDSLTSPNLSTLFNFSNNFPTFATDQFVRSILKIDYTLPNGIDLRSISGYQNGRSAWTGDIDGSSANIASISEAVNETLWSEEFNVISPDSGPITWVVGGYYQNNFYNFPLGKFDIGFPPGALDLDLNGINQTYTEAGFGQVSFKLPAGFQLQVGGRYSVWSTTNVVQWTVPEFLLNFPDNQTYKGQNITGKVALNWNVDSNNFLYAFVATGAKPGGLNGAEYFAAGFIPPPFQQEYVTDYEGGWKSSFLDGHLKTQLGFYYNTFNHFQVIVPLPQFPTVTTELNVPSGTKLYGFEASAQAVFGDLSFNVGLGISTSSVGNFFAEDPRLAAAGTCDPVVGPATAACVNLKGHPQTYAPDDTFNVSAQYNIHMDGGDTLTPAVSFAYISSQWASLFDNVAAGDYLAPRSILGASLAWTHGNIVTTLYGSNLTNDRYVAAALSPIRLAGPPLQVGISVMKPF